MPATSGSTINLKLVDPANSPAPAKKDLKVEVEAKAENGAVGKSTVTIKQGETGTSAELPTKSTGVMEVSATNPELATGGALVNIPSPNESPAPQATPAPAATIAPIETPGEHEREAVGGAARSGERTRGTARLFQTARGRAPASEAAPAASPGGASAAAAGRVGSMFRPDDFARALAGSSSPWSPVLKLRFYPNRKLRADDKDPATVWASLPSNDPAHDDLALYLMSDLGPLTPEPIKISKGSVIGQAKLVADRPGNVQVWYAYSYPPANVLDPPLKIEFVSPVWAPKLVPSPPSVTLLDTVDVAVQLVDYRGTSVVADEARAVYLSIEEGSGALAKSEVKFAANEARALTQFIPTLPGKVRLAATTPSLPTQSAEITVTMPYLLLGLCAIGSFLGGLLAYWTQQPASAQRIWIGLITGFVLYWAVAFGIVHVPNFPHPFVLNPITAVILPVFGGWGGTKVITLVLRQFGWSW
ncbi:MAG: hypothetical protein ABR514_00840 [Chthoniobacterales bacterium]